MADAISEGRRELEASLLALTHQHGEPIVFMAGMLANCLHAIETSARMELPPELRKEHLRRVIDEVFNEYCTTVEVDRVLVYKVAEGLQEQIARIQVDASQQRSPSGD